MTSADLTYTGIIRSIERLKLSANGNPRMRVTFESTGEGEAWRPGPVFQTHTDAGVGYEIENSQYRDVPVAVKLTKRGHRIYDIKVAATDERDDR